MVHELDHLHLVADRGHLPDPRGGASARLDRQRDRWTNLVFSVSAATAAGYTILDMTAMRTQTPAEYGEPLRWMLLLGMVAGVSIA